MQPPFASFVYIKSESHTMQHEYYQLSVIEIYSARTNFVIKRNWRRDQTK